MNWYRSADGETRLWYEPNEIETICEDELRLAKLYPTPDQPVTDLEAFVERHQKVRLDQYAKLESDVLGLTQFTPGKTPSISLNEDLTGAAWEYEDANLGQVGRWRATLAHEACHVLLHRYLYEPDLAQLSLFTGSPPPVATAGLHRCLKREVARPRDWKEVQANIGMAALLMPKRIFTKIARATRADTGNNDTALVSTLAERFQVSRQATQIRLKTLGFTAPAGASALSFES